MGDKLSIKQYRLIKGFKQKEVADALGVDVATVRKAEKDTDNSKVGTIKAICKFLGISIDDIFLG